MKKYVAIVAIVSCCRIAFAQHIDVQPNNAVACAGGDTSFALVLNAQASTFTYIWEFSPDQVFWDTIDMPSTTNSSFTHTLNLTNVSSANDGYYRVTVSKAMMHEVSADVRLMVVNAPPTADAGDDAVLSCGISMITLDGVNSTGEPLEYEWRNQTGDIISESSTVLVKTPGMYTLTVYNACGSDSDDVQVSQSTGDLPVINSISPASPARLTCLMTSATLIANVSNGSGQWTTPGGGTVSGFTVANVTTPGTYTFTATHPTSGCTVTATLQVILDNAPPSLTISPLNPGLCEGDTEGVKLTAGTTGTPTDYTYRWSGNPSDTTREKTALTPGIYSVTVTSKSNGCTASRTVEVDEFETPVLSNIQTPVLYYENSGSVTFGPDITPLSAQLTWRVLGYINVNMSSQQLSGADQVTRNFILSGDTRTIGTAIYSFTPTNEGCVGDSVIIEVNVLPDIDAAGDPFIPEIYTPNGDGQNDNWLVVMPDGVEKGDYTIFNRLGGKVYEGDTLTPWDGTGCPDGAYFYVLRYSQNDREVVKKGAITIIRTSN